MNSAKIWLTSSVRLSSIHRCTRTTFSAFLSVLGSARSSLELLLSHNFASTVSVDSSTDSSSTSSSCKMASKTCSTSSATEGWLRSGTSSAIPECEKFLRICASLADVLTLRTKPTNIAQRTSQCCKRVAPTARV